MWSSWLVNELKLRVMTYKGQWWYTQWEEWSVTRNGHHQCGSTHQILTSYSEETERLYCVPEGAATWNCRSASKGLQLILQFWNGAVWLAGVKNHFCFYRKGGKATGLLFGLGALQGLRCDLKGWSNQDHVNVGKWKMGQSVRWFYRKSDKPHVFFDDIMHFFKKRAMQWA